MPQLTIIAETGETSSLSLNGKELTIGRRRDNHLCLPHLSVSGYHARIYGDPDCLTLEDLGSTNGTLLNGRPIKQHFLLHSDEIIIGSYQIRYSETYTRPPEPAPDRENVTSMKPVTPIIDPDLATIISEAAALKISSGSKAGSVLPIEKPLTTVGKSGGDVGAIAKKETGYYLVPVGTEPTAMRHNGRALNPQVEIKLVGGDHIEIGGEQLEFIYPFYRY
jgi:hypothetical protein